MNLTEEREVKHSPIVPPEEWWDYLKPEHPQQPIRDAFLNPKPQG